MLPPSGQASENAAIRVPMTDTTSAYDLEATAFATLYESVTAESVHATVADFIPRDAGLLALDVGAGSGRDAAWLVSLGFDVLAVEPARGMREEAKRRHPNTRIRWLDDRLPELHTVNRLGLAFDLILLTGVWMHIPPPARARAFRKLVTLLKPGAPMLMSVREGPPDPARPMWPAPTGEVEKYASFHGLAVLRSAISADLFGRPNVHWVNMCLRLPDDGTGALPLLRGIILKEDNSSTYKLGLLRAVARIPDDTPGLGIPRADEDVIDISLGLVALNWLRMYLPLVLAELPQAPGNAGPDGLSFAKAGFRELLATRFAAQDLRIGARFAGERAHAVARALVEARRTITDVPANYMRLPADAKVFVVGPKTPFRFRGDLMLDSEFLRSFGQLTVPGHIWRTFQRMGA
jgi:SAM-dependent methyltransferase